jgi:hypothetical protein
MLQGRDVVTLHYRDVILQCRNVVFLQYNYNVAMLHCNVTMS